MAAEGILAYGVTEILKKLVSDKSYEIRQLKNLQKTLNMILVVMKDAEKKQLTSKIVRLWMKDLKTIAYEAEDVLEEYSYEVIRSKKEEDKSTVFNKVLNTFSSSKPSFIVNRKLVQQITKINEQFKIIANHMNDLGLQTIDLGSSSHDLMTKNTKPSFVASWKSANRVKKFNEKFNKIATRKNDLGLQTIDLGLSSQGRETVPLTDWKIVGRENDKSKIIDTLLDKDSCFVLSIAGMGGLGKTTLAQLVYNDEAIIKHFQLKIWILVSNPFDAKKLLKNIVNSVGTGKKYDEESTMGDIEHGLRDAFTGMKFLLVLDDVWNENPDDWYNFKNSLMIGGEGSKILVTTRSVKVAILMEDEFPHYVRILDDQDSWSLFKEIAFGLDAGAVESPELVQIGKEIVKGCGGLPLAIIYLGMFMRFKNKDEEWKIIRDTKVWHEYLEGKNNEILSSLELSFHNLSSRSKLCFSYCCLFSKDSIIQRETLIQLWMAEGFLIESPGENAMSMEEIGNEYFHSLLCNFFFQDVQDYGCILTCKMNDLIHDLAQATAGNKECLIVAQRYAHNVQYISTTRRLQLVNDLDEEMLAAASSMLNEAKELRSLFVKKTIKSVNIETVINNNRGLRVLDLSETDLEELPPSIGNLKHLRYLDLSQTNIKMLPESITKLYNLQTLKLDATTKLPKGLDELINLKHLQYS